jgi:hypothetical protein
VGELPARRGDQGCDARALVETGDDHRACRRSRHTSSLNKISWAIEAKPAGRRVSLQKRISMK